MEELQKKISQFMSEMNPKRPNSSIGVFFKSEDDLRRTVKELNSFLKNNKFIVVNTLKDCFTINNLCKITFLVARDYLVGNRFTHVIYDTNINSVLIKYIVTPSYTGMGNDRLAGIDFKT